MTGECMHCGGALREYPAAKTGTRVERARWECTSCHRAGKYAHGTSTSGRPFRARIELVAGAPALRWPWVPAESVPYEERVRA